MKRFVSIFMVALLMVTMFTGCQKKVNEVNTNDVQQNTEDTTVTNTPTEKTKITYLQFSAGETNAEVIKNMIAKFETDNPDIQVELQSLGYEEYFTALATKMAGNSAPDCFELNMENFLTYAIRDSIEPLDSYFESTGATKEIYSEGPIKAATYNGKLYAIPQSFSTVVLIYNKNLFDQAGISYPTDEWTWADEQAAAEKIRTLGDDIWGTFQPISYHELYKTVKTNGGSLVSDNGKTFTVNSSENIETLQMMLNRVGGDNRVMPNAEDMAGRGDWDMFKAGNLGMIHTGIWAFTDYAQNIKDFEWDIAVEPGNKAKATHFFANVACVNKNSNNKEAAFRFINYMASNGDVVKMRLDAQWELPTISDEVIMAQYLEQTPPANRAAVMKSLDYAAAPPALLKYSEVVDVINPMLEGAVIDNMSAEEVLNSIQDELVSKKLMNE
ncbi:MAG: transporter, solute-binding protein [Anaerocolumna sp.]|jgi:multiple sugar transport system substrate-binding protein|nr:transporter, solute-binding protein [Anaerocolumna sp.]